MLRTTNCPYCEGSGLQAWCKDYPLSDQCRCLNCLSTGQRCIICSKPVLDEELKNEGFGGEYAIVCECPSSHFDKDPETRTTPPPPEQRKGGF